MGYAAPSHATRPRTCQPTLLQAVQYNKMHATVHAATCAGTFPAASPQGSLRTPSSRDVSDTYSSSRQIKHKGACQLTYMCRGLLDLVFLDCPVYRLESEE